MLATAAAVVVLLVAVAARYGYHRDELYFRAAGHHLAWGYPDQPPLAPLIARLMSSVKDTVFWLRLPSAVTAGAIVVVTGLTTREVGGGRGAQLLAAASMAVGSVTLGTGHLLSTATFDLLAWTLLVWLIVRILRTGDDRFWLAVGVVAGVGLFDSDLVAFLMGGIVAGIVIAGPRSTLSSKWLWVGGAIAALLWSPYVMWQAQHGWPQLAISREIAQGKSGSSTPRALLLPMQLVLLSPFLAPVWIAGLVRLFRDPALRWCRAIGWAYVVLAVVFVVAGGKGYYLAGLFPVLLATGAQPTIDWMRRGRAGLRRALVVLAVVLSLGSMPVTLPLVPVGSLHTSGIVKLNYDAGETVAWPTYVRQIADVYRGLPAAQRQATAIVTGNYGDAGAVTRFGPALGVPLAYSGHMGFWYWGPPLESANTIVAVSLGGHFLRRFFADCTLATTLHNPYRIDNDEQGNPVWVCSGRRGSWQAIWPHFKST